MKNYKISVIIPVYNAEEYLVQCLDSLVNQTYQNIEIVAINDASTDNSLSILYDYEKRYHNVKVINSKKNERQGGARNKGIRSCTGDYISFIDSDDWIEVDAYEKFNHILNKNNYDAVCCCKSYREYHNGKTSVLEDGNKMFLYSIANKELTSIEVEQLLYKGPGVCQNIYKSSLLKDNNIFFPEGVSYEDNYFVPLFYAYVRKIAVMEIPFYHYRENLNSTSFRKDNTQLDRVKIEKLRFQEFNKRNLLNDLQNGYEMLTLKLYYLITLGTIYKYFNNDFIHLAKKLKSDFYNIYPNFRKNIYYKKDLSWSDKLKIISMEITPYLLLCLFKIRDRMENRNEH